MTSPSRAIPGRASVCFMIGWTLIIASTVFLGIGMSSQAGDLCTDAMVFFVLGLASIFTTLIMIDKG